MLPQHKNAEQIVLGLAIDNPIIAHQVAKLNNNLFYEPIYKKIHLAVARCIQGSYGLDSFTIANMVKTVKIKGLYKDIELLDVIQLIDNLPPKSQINAYIKMLKEAQTQRDILSMCQDTAEKLRGRLFYQSEIDEIVNGFKNNLFKIRTTDQRVAEHAHSSAAKAVEKIESAIKHGEQENGIPSGFPALDEITSGFREGQLIVLCGRPGMGKTSLALDICAHSSSSKPNCSRTSYFFSLEMSTEEISARLLSKLSNVNLKNLRTTDISNSDLKQLRIAALNLLDHKLVIDDSPQLSPASIKARITEREVLYDEKPDIIFVDYLQLMAPDQKQNSREREVAGMSRDLKLLARELNMPVVVMSQLNRELEKRPNRRPIMADIRESGAVEQDADIIIALYQPFLYTNNVSDQGKAEAIILKHRNGPIGTVPLIWRSATSSFFPVHINGASYFREEPNKSAVLAKPDETDDGPEIEYTCFSPDNAANISKTVNERELPF